MLKVKDLRDSFIDFFKERDHRIIPSSPLIPRDDPTLLFTTAGMVQFKPMFAGTVKLDYTRAASVQKCLRTSDLENVGRTKRHCTFFEMLGNFSFGDYFKDEAVKFAWDYSTDVIGFPKDQIWVSIYTDDDEAFNIWHKNIGIPEKRIVRLGKADNFWGPAGDSGACGPCSELYLDRGPAFGCGSADCRPGCDCERFLEYWNLVFNQFNQDTAGNLHPLPRTGIDTGMGLERLATLVQNVDSIYQTDEFTRLINFVCSEADVKYEGENIPPVNVLVEHSRALTFAIADGAYPSNEGRGYVLRRILRRALRYGRQIGIREPFIYKITDPLVNIMGKYYPEIIPASKNVKSLILGEEKRFLETLDTGMNRLNEILETASKTSDKTIKGADAFVLYDTFGFPLEMTVEIAKEKNYSVDVNGFENEMEKQRERGKQSWKAADTLSEKLFNKLTSAAGSTRFTGYEENITATEITALGSGDTIMHTLKAGDKGYITTKATSFYGESGGQVGDKGFIFSEESSDNVFRVDDTKKHEGTFIHAGEMIKGSLKTGDAVRTEIDSLRRNLIRANHTATHLLQAALRKVLGNHVYQSGSLVDPERFRFDFSHFAALSEKEISDIESIVNEKIWEGIPVKTEIMNINEATSKGAIAVFDEKYGETVRVVSVDNYSMELCGGTHVDNTGRIGVFKILKEASPGAGIRRIEAITLKGIFDRLTAQTCILAGIGNELNTAESEFPGRIKDTLDRISSLEKEIKKLKTQNLASDVDAIIADAADVNGVKVIIKEFKDADADELRRISDIIRSKEKNALICFGSKTEGRALLLSAATKGAVEKGADCGAIIKEISKIVGGGGGGKKDMAQAGGKSPERLQEALKEAFTRAKAAIK